MNNHKAIWTMHYTPREIYGMPIGLTFEESVAFAKRCHKAHRSARRMTRLVPNLAWVAEGTKERFDAAIRSIRCELF